MHSTTNWTLPLGLRPRGQAETLNHYRALALATGATAEARSHHGQLLRLARKILSAKDGTDALRVRTAWKA
jgi:hypothetical protein